MAEKRVRDEPEASTCERCMELERCVSFSVLTRKWPFFLIHEALSLSFHYNQDCFSYRKTVGRRSGNQCHHHIIVTVSLRCVLSIRVNPVLKCQRYSVFL